MTKERMLVLDSNSLMNRAFYALPPLTNNEGLHTNAVFGFTTMLLKMKEEIKPDYIVAAFDRKAPTFRHNEYKDYKAGRKKMPEELAEQFPVIKDLLNKLSINIFEIDGFEADDLIGTLAVYAEKNDIEVYIVTGDRDALQLASDNIKVVITKKGITEKEIYDKNRMIEDYGVTPKQFIDVKGLMGDASDNIPGVPGIGEKTAFKLIKEYGSIENVLSNINSINGKKIKENLTEYSEQAVFSKRLATIITDVPVEMDLDDIKSQDNYDADGVKQMFYKLQFKSLLDEIPDSDKTTVKAEEKDLSFINIETVSELDELFSRIVLSCSNEGFTEIFIIFDIENGNVYSKSFISKIYMKYNSELYSINMQQIIHEDDENAVNILKSVFDSTSILKIGFDVKVPHTILHKMGIEFNGVKFDAKIAAYLLDSSKGEYNLNEIEEEMLRINIDGEGEKVKIKEVYYLEQLYNELNKNIKESNMERVDKEKLSELGEKFKREILLTQKVIYELADEEFNINSPKQLGKVLFEKLDLPVIKKTKTGYSTNAEVLEALSDKHPIIEKIIYYRQLTKLYSTYVEGLMAVIDDDEKIHSSFNQAVTTTGRLSSTEPNLQNIPIKHELGREIRKVFVPENENCVILSADYSQIELRVLAHIANDENLINAFINHSDIHTKTASEVFKVPIDQVTPIMRSNAKAVNFGIVYGIGEFSLAKDLKISRKEAKQYIDTYFERYPNVKKYMDDIIKQARESLYVTTIMNRRRFIPEIQASNKMVRSFGERLAMNTPIQGSAADIIKMAMVKVYKQLNDKKLKSKLILQVHDELIVNVYKDELDVVKNIVKDAMENVLKLRVPLEVDINIGNTWYDAK